MIKTDFLLSTFSNNNKFGKSRKITCLLYKVNLLNNIPFIYNFY